MSRWLDQFLGDTLGETAREDVLSALHDHIDRSVVIEVEVPGQHRPLLHLEGTLVAAGRNLETSNSPDSFTVVSPPVAAVWHSVGPEWETHLASDKASPWQREAYKAAAWSWPWFRVPRSGIEKYISVSHPASGYRFALGGGATLAIMLWHDAMPEPDSGDVEPGQGAFTAEAPKYPESGAE
jgi:hypothetical protein